MYQISGLRRNRNDEKNGLIQDLSALLKAKTNEWEVLNRLLGIDEIQ